MVGWGRIGRLVLFGESGTSVAKPLLLCLGFVALKGVFALEQGREMNQELG
jgi:hypothetical protein